MARAAAGAPSSSSALEGEGTDSEGPPALRLSSGCISKKHAELELTGAGQAWFLTDLGSTNGTFIARGGANLRCQPHVKFGMSHGELVRCQPGASPHVHSAMCVYLLACTGDPRPGIQLEWQGSLPLPIKSLPQGPRATAGSATSRRW